MLRLELDFRVRVGFGLVVVMVKVRVRGKRMHYVNECPQGYKGIQTSISVSVSVCERDNKDNINIRIYCKDKRVFPPLLLFKNEHGLCDVCFVCILCFIASATNR